MAGRNAFFGRLNDLPFTKQNVTQSDFARTRFVPDVAALSGEVRQFRQRKRLASRPAQRLLPQLTLKHDGVSVEQMFLSPLHGIGQGQRLFIGWSLRGLVAQTAEVLTLLSRQLRFPQGKQLGPT